MKVGRRGNLRLEIRSRPGTVLRVLAFVHAFVHASVHGREMRSRYWLSSSGSWITCTNVFNTCEWIQMHLCVRAVPSILPEEL